MGSHQFDKIIKDKLQFHKSKVDSALWDKIEAQLPVQEESRRFPFWWTTSAIVTGLILLGGLIWYAGKKEESKISSPVASAINTKAIDDEAKPIVIQGTSGVASDEALLPSHHRPSWQKSSNTPPIRTYISKPSDAAGFNARATNRSENEILKDNSFSVYSEENQIYAGQSILTSSQATFDAASPLKQLRVFPHPSKSKKIVIKDNCLDDFNHGKKGVYLEAYFGNDFPIRTLEAREEAFNQVVQSRKETETPLYSYSLGARLGFNLSEHFKLMTGVHYSQINEKFEFVDPESSQTIINLTKVYIKDANGMIKDSTFSYDTVYIPGTLIYKIRNQYTMIDLPFLLGWQAYSSDKMSIFVNAGVMANLSFKKEGMALVDDRYVVRTFQNMSSNTFNHSLGLSTYIGAQFCYRLPTGLEFFLEPNVRIQHRGLTTKDYPVKQNYTTPSVLIGSKYNF